MPSAQDIVKQAERLSGLYDVDDYGCMNLLALQKSLRVSIMKTKRFGDELEYFMKLPCPRGIPQF